MATLLRVGFLGVLLTAVGLMALFYVQNELTRVDVWLNLGLGAWKTREPLPLPLLLLGSGAVGSLVVSLLAGISILRLERRVRRLTGELRRLEAKGGASPGKRTFGWDEESS